MTNTRLKLYHDKFNPYWGWELPQKQPVPYYGNMDLFAIIESNKWEFTDVVSEADVIPVCLAHPYDDPISYKHLYGKDFNENQVILSLNLWQVDSHMNPSWYRSHDHMSIRNMHDKVIIVHCNLNDDCIDPRYVCHDIMWNRQKYFMCDNPDPICFNNKYWMGNSKKEFYTYGPIAKELTEDSKKILCLNRIYTFENHFIPHRKARTDLANCVESFDSIYLSNPNLGIFLGPNGWDEEFNSKKTSGSWYPVADQYYNTSYVNVYVESMVDSGECSVGELITVSEKTFDPLIKGNFILPFSTCNFVELLTKYYGFKFPDWIDYSYEKYEDFDQRLYYFLEEVKRINTLPIEKLHEYYLRDKYILEHNRQVFIDRPYDSLHDKVLHCMNLLGWD